MKTKSPNKSRKGKRKPKLPGSTGSRARRSGRSPTVKQTKYVRGVVAGKTKKQAALDAGYGPGVAKNPGQKLDANPAVKALFTSLMEKAGVTDHLLACRLYQGLYAMQTKFATHEGILADRRNLVDFAERREMLEIALKLKGHLIDKHELRLTRTLEEILEASREDPHE